MDDHRQEDFSRRRGNGDPIFLHQGILAQRVGYGQADGVGAGFVENVNGVLLGRGAAVAEIPQPGSRPAGCRVGQVHGQGRLSAERAGSEAGLRRGDEWHDGDVAILA